MMIQGWLIRTSKKTYRWRTLVTLVRT